MADALASPAPRVLLHAFSTFTLGGAQARFVTLANAWAQDAQDPQAPRFRHLVMAMDGRFDAGERLHPAVDWQPLQLPVLRGAGLANRAAFAKVLQDLAPDQLLTYNWGAIEWVAANLSHWPRQRPLVHVEDGFGPDEAQQQQPRRRWMRRLLLGLGGARLVVPSRTLQAHGRGWWLPPQRLHYIPNGIELGPPPAPRPLPAAARPLVLGTVAGLRAEKNLPRLLRAFARLHAQRPAELRIVGDGPERAALQQLAAQLGVAHAVHFSGYVPNPRDHLRQFDVFALSSDTEQQPLALLEALAEGVPVVSTRVGDVPHMLPAEAADGLSDIADEAFAQALLRVALAPERWPARVAAGRAHVAAHYRLDAMLAAWRQVCEGREPAR